MKTVLVLAHWYYPIYHGGVPRVAKFCKYLSEFGVIPVLIAPDWKCFARWPKSNETDCCEVIRVKDEACECEARVPFLKKHLLMPFRDLEDMFYSRLEKKMLNKALEVCSDRHIDAIFASSFPQYIHRIASKLHKKTGIEWVADYRDLVDQEEYTAKGRLKPIKRYINNIYRSNYISRDRRYVKTASHVTTVSEGLQQRLEQRKIVPKVSVIMNGYDPEDYDCAERDKRNEKLTIRYTGSTYGASRIDCLGKGFALAVSRCPEIVDNIVFEFYGTSCRNIEKMAKPYPELLKVIRPCGSLAHDKIVEKQCGADILFLISHQAKGIVTGKIFEYLAAEKHILSVPGDGDATDRILQKTGLGTVADSPEAVCQYLCEKFDEWKTNGILSSEPDREYISRFSRRESARKLAEILNLL